MERYKDLNSKSADQTFWDTLEIVHLYEFIEIHWEHLEK